MKIELDKRVKYLVAVSGGMDSMTLLDMMVKQKYDIIVAHVNYHKRSDSNNDTEVVKKYCKKNQIILEVLDVENKDYDTTNFQNQARQIRYRFFSTLKNKYGVNDLVVAHHEDDHIETALIQKQRKADYQYLGLKKKNNLFNLVVHRPLLNITKKQIKEYVKANNIIYYEDSTNNTDIYLRNKIRHNKVNKMNLKQKQKIINEINEENEKKELNKEIINKEINNIIINDKIMIKEFLKSNYKKEVIYYYLNKYLNITKVKRNYLNEINKLINSDKANAKININEKYELHKKYDYLYYCKVNKEKKENYCFVFDSLIEYKNEYFKLAFEGNDREGICLKESDFPITIRNRREGDVIETLSGTKKVKKLFIDQKIDVEFRNKIPIMLNSSNEIILIPNVSKNKRYCYLKNNLFVVQ